VNIDEAIEQMELEDLEGATVMPPIDYAKLRGLRPQKVYKAIRDGRLENRRCECGRKVVDVDTADKLFSAGAYKAVPQTEEVSGRELDATE
jgi:hypothetical protein